MSITAQEKDTYDEMWGHAAYAEFSPGEKYLGAFLDMSNAQPGQSVLDAGCGSGKGALALQSAGFNTQMFDLSREGLVEEAKSLPFDQGCIWEISGHYERAFPWVYCCDVLEHIPTQFTMLTISELLKITRYGLFLSITLVPDTFGVLVGKSLHQTVQPFTWWRDSIKELGILRECRDLITTGLYLVEPR